MYVCMFTVAARARRGVTEFGIRAVPCDKISQSACHRHHHCKLSFILSYAQVSTIKLSMIDTLAWIRYKPRRIAIQLQRSTELSRYCSIVRGALCRSDHGFMIWNGYSRCVIWRTICKSHLPADASLETPEYGRSR